MPTTTEEFKLIADQERLSKACDVIAEATQVALDTEFMRTNTYEPELSLIQVNTNNQIYCIDPLTELDMQRFWELLFEPTRMSVLHAAKQDMEVLWYEQQAVVGNLIDTQVCASLLGHPAQIGYAGLVAELLDIEIDKGQTRTDWSKRPLSAAQLQYAAADVSHLPKLLDQMRTDLENLGRFDWALEDSAALLDKDLYEPQPALAWQRVKSIPYLPVAEQARARALAEWRERAAIKSNRPRQWILADKALLQIAQDNPSNEKSLSSVQNLPPAVIRKQGRKLLAVIDSANQAFARGETELEQLTPDRDQNKSAYKKLAGIVKAKADALNIAPEVLASKRDIQALLRNEPQARVGNGWRKSVIGDELIAAL